MSETQRKSENADPLQTLGLPRDASELDVRQRYLELVREFPPERDAARFQQIHAAYKAAGDPLVVAQRLIDDDPDEPSTPWQDILKEQQSQPPRLAVDVLLSLGNRADAASPVATRADA